MLMPVLRDEVIGTRRDDDSAPTGDGEYFGREIHEARQMHNMRPRSGERSAPVMSVPSRSGSSSHKSSAPTW